MINVTKTYDEMRQGETHTLSLQACFILVLECARFILVLFIKLSITAKSGLAMLISECVRTCVRVFLKKNMNAC